MSARGSWARAAATAPGLTIGRGRYRDPRCSPSLGAVFRQGETGNEWFAIYRGSVDVAVSKTGNLLDSEVVCTLFEGYAFGEAAILGNSPR